MGGFQDIEAGLGVRGRFVIDSVIAEGGMSTVYRATQVSLDRPVALKVLRRTPGWQADLEQRFLAEAQLAARIAHPNVVRVLEPGSGPLGLYIAYELVEGHSLRETMARRIKAERALQLMLQAVAALDAVHKAGAVHRDVKPENLLVDRQGALRLTDLGIAKDFSGSLMTRTGVIFGTPAYMSPEQCRGEPVDSTSDLYSLGIVVYELLAGSPPFRRDGPAELLDAHLRETPEAPSSRNPALPGTWDATLLKALEKDPRRRYRSAREMSKALERLLLEAEDPAIARGVSARTSSAARSQATVSAEHSRPALPSSVTLLSGSDLVLRPSPGAGRRWGLGLAAAAVALGLAWWSVGGPDPRRGGQQPPPTASAQTGKTTTGPAAVVSNAPTPAATAPAAPGDPLLAGVIASLKAERAIAPPVEPHPSPPAGPPGTRYYVCRFLLVELRTMHNPRLRLSVESAPGTSAAPAGAPVTAPRVVLETTRAAAGLTFARESAGDGREVWVAGLTPAQLHDGLNRVRLEVPGPGTDRGPRLTLAFERSPAFPALSTVDPAKLCPSCCPELRAVSEIWNRYDHGQLFRARKAAAALREKWPRCGSLIIVQAFTDFRIALECRTVGDMTLSFSTTVLGDEPEPIPPAWKLQDEAGEQLDEGIRLYPGWQEPFYRYSRTSQSLKSWDVALRAARYAVALKPADGRQWMELAETERGLLKASQEAREAVGWRGTPQLALAHINRCVELLAATGGAGPREWFAQAQLMLLAGQREAARVVLRQLLAAKPEMREARALLASLGPRR